MHFWCVTPRMRKLVRTSGPLTSLVVLSIIGYCIVPVSFKRAAWFRNVFSETLGNAKMLRHWACIIFFCQSASYVMKPTDSDSGHTLIDVRLRCRYMVHCCGNFLFLQRTYEVIITNVSLDLRSAGRFPLAMNRKYTSETAPTKLNNKQRLPQLRGSGGCWAPPFLSAKIPLCIRVPRSIRYG